MARRQVECPPRGGVAHGLVAAGGAGRGSSVQITRVSARLQNQRWPAQVALHELGPSSGTFISSTVMSSGSQPSSGALS